MRIIALSIMLLSAVVSATAQVIKKEAKSKTLVVYYSRTGNTQIIAERIQALTGADIFRVETVKDYPSEYEPTTEIAKEEKNSGARPAIKGRVGNIDRYDTVFIGFPIWWGTYPMAIATFLDSHDLAGKTVVPFCTHGGGGVDQGFVDVQKASAGANHLQGFAVSGSRAAESAGNVEKWLRGINVIK